MTNVTMKTVYRTHYGTPDVLRITETATPVPGEHALLVEVHAATVNRTDCAILSAKPFIMRFFVGLFRPKRTATGTDFAGIVTATGNSVTQFKTGDRVYGFDDLGLSSHAEYLVINEKKAIRTIPEGITFQHAAASLEAAHWAYNCLNKVDWHPGKKVLINGATGGIGSALVQFANYKGAIVTAVCRAEHFDRVRALGAGKLIDYTTQDFTNEDATYDLILDAVGKSTYYKCKKLLRPKGVYISSEPGPYGQNLYLPLLTSIVGGTRVIFPLPKSISDSMDFVRGLLVEGKFTPLIDRAYSLEEIREAFTYVASGQKVGNVLLRLKED